MSEIYFSINFRVIFTIYNPDGKIVIDTVEEDIEESLDCVIHRIIDGTNEDVDWGSNEYDHTDFTSYTLDPIKMLDQMRDYVSKNKEQTLNGYKIVYDDVYQRWCDSLNDGTDYDVKMTDF